MQSIKSILTQHSYDTRCDPTPADPHKQPRGRRAAWPWVPSPTHQAPHHLPLAPCFQQGGSLKKHLGDLWEKGSGRFWTLEEHSHLPTNQGHHGNSLLPLGGPLVPETRQRPHVRHVLFKSDSVQNTGDVSADSATERQQCRNTAPGEPGWLDMCVHSHSTHAHVCARRYTRTHFLAHVHAGHLCGPAL